MMRDQTCSDCGRCTFVITRDADLVCTGCGLVAQERLIDEGPEWRSFEHERAEDTTDTGWKCKLLYDIEDTLDDVMKQAIDNLWQQVHYPKAPSKPLFLCCMYLVSQRLCRGWTVNQCLNILPGCNVERSAFWDVYNKVSKSASAVKETQWQNDSKNLGICKRIVHDMDIEGQHEVLKLVHKLCETVRTSGCQGSAKASKFCASIVWVACSKLNISVDVKTFCEKYDVGVHTLKKYRDTIQKICL